VPRSAPCGDCCATLAKREQGNKPVVRRQVTRIVRPRTVDMRERIYEPGRVPSRQRRVQVTPQTTKVHPPMAKEYQCRDDDRDVIKPRDQSMPSVFDQVGTYFCKNRRRMVLGRSPDYPADLCPPESGIGRVRVFSVSVKA
jgi:hypothetical protein